MIRFVAVAAGSAILLAGPPPAVAAEVLTAEQKRQVEQIVRDYLLANPEIILESVRTYQAKQEAAEEAETQAILVAQRQAIERDPMTPIAGNPKGDVTIVEFFDYNCGYCKRMVPAMQELLATDKNVRYVFKELPILSPASHTAAKAALAAWMLSPQSYLPVHVALMSSRGVLSEEKIFAAIEQAGLDVAKVRAKMTDPAVEGALQANADLARLLNIRGTPAIIVGNQLVAGAVELSKLKDLVAQARAG